MPEQEDQIQRSNWIREQIERLKSGRSIKRADHARSLREQIADRAVRVRPPVPPKRNT